MDTATTTGRSPARENWEEAGTVLIPGTLTPERVAALLAEAHELLPTAAPHIHNHTSAHRDGSFASPVHCAFLDGGPALQALAYDKEFLTALRKATGIPRLIPRGGAIVVYEDGDFQGLHADSVKSTVTVTAALSDTLAPMGWAPHLRNAHPDTLAPIRHKEILAALDEGVTVVGASSMGALRAAELHPYGMIGVGRIYRDYRSGALDADDEVALVQGPDDTALPEPLVNLRAQLRRAADAGRISRREAHALTDLVRSLPYPRRSWTALGRAAAAADARLVDAHARADTHRLEHPWDQNPTTRRKRSPYSPPSTSPPTPLTHQKPTRAGRRNRRARASCTTGTPPTAQASRVPRRSSPCCSTSRSTTLRSPTGGRPPGPGTPGPARRDPGRPPRRGPGRPHLTAARSLADRPGTDPAGPPRDPHPHHGALRPHGRGLDRMAGLPARRRTAPERRPRHRAGRG